MRSQTKVWKLATLDAHRKLVIVPSTDDNNKSSVMRYVKQQKNKRSN